jgi:hypothetical protein
VQTNHLANLFSDVMYFGLSQQEEAESTIEIGIEIRHLFPFLFRGNRKIQFDSEATSLARSEEFN